MSSYLHWSSQKGPGPFNRPRPSLSRQIVRGLCQLAPFGFLVFIPLSYLFAQGEREGTRRAAASEGQIQGRLVASGTGQPIRSGSIGVRRDGDSAFTSGDIPDTNGVFHVERLRFGRYAIRIRALGFAPLTRTMIVISVDHPIADLGTLLLDAAATELAAQQVNAERPDVVLAPDRNVYSTKNMTAASGGTAIDVLRNVPSVEVDGSNNVSLRGNQNVVIQINGRPSPLKGSQLGNFLGQLPASMVKNVEVVSNPSAKNDPDGTAGIININLNQEADLGLGGGLTMGTGSTRQANFSGNIGRQSGALTLFVSYGFFYNHQQSNGYTDQTNLTIPIPVFVHSEIDGSSRPLWQNATFRSEYRLRKQSAFSFDAMVSGGHFGGNTDSYFSDLDASGQIIGLFNEFTKTEANGINQDYDLAFRHEGGPKARTYGTELRMTQANQHSANNMYGVVSRGDASTGAAVLPAEHDQTVNGVPAWNLQSDYAQPLGSHGKLETGVKEILRRSTDDFTAAYLDSASGQFVIAPSRTTAFDYREQIGAGYALLSQQMGKVQVQAGLRLEVAATQFVLPDSALSGARYDNRYASAFPSGVLSYNFTPMRQVKLSYSRRINRPNPFQLSPVEQHQDARNLFRGNPTLHPEYTDALELALQETRAWGSLQLTPYLRRTAHAVRFIRTVDTTGVTLGTFDNVASSLQTGTDFNVSYRRGPLTLFTGASVYRYVSDAGNLSAGNFSTKTGVWSARLNLTWKLMAALDASFAGNYRSAMATEGGSVKSFVFSNLALRYKMWHDKGSLTLRSTDPFGLMNFGSVTSNPAVIQETVRNFGARGVFLTFSRNFGQQLKLRPRQMEGEQPPTQPGVP